MKPTRVFVLLAALALSGPALAEDGANDADALVGLWSFETTYAPDPPGGRKQGYFWIRPGITADPRFPQGSSQPFATPLTAAIRGLPNPFTLYLKVFRDGQGTLLGAFRNHDQNSNGGASWFRVSRSGDAVRFEAGGDPGPPTVVLEGTLAGPKKLAMRWRDLDRTIELVKRKPAQVPEFFPRPPGKKVPAYYKPRRTDDGWRPVHAKDVGMDPDALTRLTERLAAADPAARRASLIHSVLVAYRGELVFEEYFHGYDRDRVHDTRSAGKTLASVMLGAAMLRNVKLGPDSKVYELLRDKGPFANPDPRKDRITLAHLMTHTAGLACDDNDDASPGNENTLQAQDRQPDWWKFTLDLPMAHDPGVRYAYCSANTNLVGAALTAASGEWLPEFFARAIARPMHFDGWHWNLQPNDEGYLGGGAWLRPRDLLKIGQMYLDGGRWRGVLIVPESWVQESTAPRVRITPETTGLTPEQFGEFYGEGTDGYAWHLGQVRSGERTFASYAASGNGGQILLVVPELQLAVVFTGGNYRQGGIWSRWVDEIVGGDIIPALRLPPAGP
jgi:CubicO group peptidase (beta-lactamase class C family)